jgi:WXG100 family type VII secretion target
MSSPLTAPSQSVPDSETDPSLCARFQFAQGAKSGQNKAARSAALWLIDNGESLIERAIMAQAIMDPEQVRRFAEELKRFNSDLQDRITSLQARFAGLGDTWQDQEHTQFAEEFKQTMKAMKKFIEVSNQHGPYLLRKAQRIEDYLNQR